MRRLRYALREFIRCAADLPYVLDAPFSWATRGRILLAYWRLTLRMVTLVRRKPRKIRIFDFQVTAPHYNVVQFLFRELFVLGSYFFYSASARPVIVDGGANIGLATLYFKWLHPESTIHCFEPDATAFSFLVKNLEQNRVAGVVPHCLALSGQDSEVDFFIDKDEPASLRASTLFERSPHQRTRVPAARLSSFLSGQEVDFLKLDIEGAEAAVLADLVASGSLYKVRALAVEYHHGIEHQPSGLSQFLSSLEQCGFEYRLQADRGTCGRVEGVQDIMIYAVRGAPAYPSHVDLVPSG